MLVSRICSVVVMSSVLSACGTRAVDVNETSGSGDQAEATVGSEDTSPGSVDTGAAEDGGEATGSDPESTGSTTSNFVPDGGGPDCGVERDPWGNDCSEGEKCTLVACEVGGNSWDTFVCRDIQGDDQLLEPCNLTDGSGVSGNDTCAPELMCWDVDPDTLEGYCITWCYGPGADYKECPAGTVCVGGQVLGFCLPSCDPLEQDCDSPDDICVPAYSGDGYRCVLDASGDQAPYGTPCAYVNSCNAGLMCIESAEVPEASCDGASGCCSPFCSISAGEPCPGEGQTCEPVFDLQPETFEDVGVCRLLGP